MMKDSLNKKTYIGDIEPNPKEFGIWVKQDGTAKVYDYINNEWKGGSGSGESSGDSSNIEYLDLSGLEQNIKGRLIMFAYLLRGNDSGIIAPISFVLNSPDIDMSNIGEFVDMISIDFNMDIYMLGSNMKIKNMFDENIINIIPRITKEQFYSLT